MVHVYDYNLNLSFTLVVGGYTCSPLENWINTFAQLIGNKDADNAVRFGHDGTKCCIIIGETTSTWDHLKVTVKDFQAGYSNYSVDQWDDGWSISLITTLPAQIDKTYSNSLLDANAVRTLAGSDLEPAEAGADVTGDNTAYNTNYVEESFTRSGYDYNVYGDIKVWSGGDLIFYDSSSYRIISIYAYSTNYAVIAVPSTSALSIGGGNQLDLDSSHGSIWLGNYMGSEYDTIQMLCDGHIKMEILSSRINLNELTYLSAGLETRNVAPAADNTYYAGRSDVRYSDIHCVTLHQGDLCMTDLTCYKCGEVFQEGDDLIYTVIEADDKEIRCVPVCLNCKKGK
jgi:hypothetical protein